MSAVLSPSPESVRWDAATAICARCGCETGDFYLRCPRTGMVRNTLPFCRDCFEIESLWSRRQAMVDALVAAGHVGRAGQPLARRSISQEMKRASAPRAGFGERRARRAERGD
jgi:hypothetical protein